MAIMPTEHITEPSEIDAAELCIERLSRKLAEVEIVMATNEGKANQMRKERDAARTTNERLRKEITRLNNELFKVRMNTSLKEVEIREEQDSKDGTNGEGNINYDALTSQKRRTSLPVTAWWRQTGRRDSLDHPRDLKKLLDKRSNELLQQRQQYRIFENRFESEAERCSKLEKDAERLKQLLGDLLGIHGRHHHSCAFPCSQKVTLAVFAALIALTIIAVFVLE